MVDISEVKKFLNKRDEEKKANNYRLFDQALRDRNNIVDMIIKDYNPERIFIWGSLLDKDKFRDYSDIDIAIEGSFSAKEFFDMYGKAEKMTDFPLDIVELDKIEPEFRDSIMRRGKILYER